MSKLVGFVRPRVLVALAALVLSFATGVDAGEPASIRIGSWNIEHLGNPGARSRDAGAQGVLQSAEDLANYIRFAKVDLLAVQEASADRGTPPGFPTAFRSNEQLLATCKLLNRDKANDWKHVLFPKRYSANRNQWVGIAWNGARVKPVGNIYRVFLTAQRSSQGKTIFDRNLHAMKFSFGEGKTDVLILPIHLKANYNGNFDKHRTEELEELVTRLPSIRKAFPREQDIIIVGDTNIKYVGEKTPGVLTRAGFKDLNSSNVDTFVWQGIQPFDRFFVPADQPEFKSAKQHTVRDFLAANRLSERDFLRRFSDHFMIVTEVRILQDDD